MSQLDIHQFPCLSDNYGVLIHDAKNDLTASIDAPDADAVQAALTEKGWTLTHILTTHHHADHTGGNAALKAATGCKIIGPKAEAAKIPTLDETVGEGDTFKFGDFEVRVFETPGHTLGHISYYLPDAGVAFVGDTMFAMGCGRLFEGDAKTMWSSLSKLMALPDETVLYCGHEYTLSNARFAVDVDPNNQALKTRMVEVQALRDKGEPTLPTTLALEKATSPFLRASDPELRAHLGLQDAQDWEVFAEVRSRKDNA
ncbi:MAG: hydroxyacylglutathione hydrolase [Pseudomonadota bacterium]